MVVPAECASLDRRAAIEMPAGLMSAHSLALKESLRLRLGETSPLRIGLEAVDTVRVQERLAIE